MSPWKNLKTLALSALALLAFGPAAWAGGGGPVGPVQAFVGDFNGDDISDLLWRNTSTGALAVWLMNNDGTVASTGFIGTPGASWVIRGVAFVDSDAKSDIVWQNTSTGTVKAWFMNGVTASSTGVLGNSPGSVWELQAAGDVNNDDKADLVFRRSDNGNVSVWVMDGTTRTSAASYAGPSPGTWEIRGIGDFNQDNKGDIVWERTSGTGAAFAWTMDGTARTGTIVLGVAFNNEWDIASVLDLNADGGGDLFFGRSTANTTSAWSLTGAALSGSTSYGVNLSTWTVGGAGTFGGGTDGDDVAFYKGADGSSAIWFMNGSTRDSSAVVDTTAGANWVVSNAGQ